MSRFVLALVLLAAPSLCALPTFRVEGTDPAPWRQVFGCVNIHEAQDASIVVLGPGSKTDGQALAKDHIVVLEGTGMPATQSTIAVRQIRDTHAPELEIIWEQPQTLPLTELPAGWTIFASERWQNAPLLAGKRTWQGALLWMAASPGKSGYERFPYLLHALADLGVDFPVRSVDIWAFFDSAYRIRADVDYLAKKWRKAGIAALQVAAWHNMDGDPAQDAYLQKLIDACHRNAILVYAWLELPHVSDKFWAKHPEWREKTALGQDAQLDWRKLMNLQNPNCQREAARLISDMLRKFDWDGVNLAELYFESLEGISNPARFTPMNADVRAEFEQLYGFDPKELLTPGSKYAGDAAAQRKFLQFRATLAARMQSDWLKQVDAVKQDKPYLDTVLTHIDDRFDKGIRDELGADVARIMPLVHAGGGTLLVEDPATLWDRGPSRYSELADQYQKLSPNMADIAVDVNVVDRYQDVYPTKKQTGVELLELVHQAAASFSKLAIYGESSVLSQDVPLLGAAASVTKIEQTTPDEWNITAKSKVRIAWSGPAELDGKPWPIQDDGSVSVPTGKHRLAAGVAVPAVTLIDFSAEIRSVNVGSNETTLSYSARTRAIAVLATKVSAIEVDGQDVECRGDSILLPQGQHVVTFRR